MTTRGNHHKLLAIFFAPKGHGSRLSPCWQALAPGGRLVANAVTVEGEQALMAWHGSHGGDLLRIAVTRSEPVGGYRGWRPLMPVTQYAGSKP